MTYRSLDELDGALAKEMRQRDSKRASPVKQRFHCFICTRMTFDTRTLANGYKCYVHRTCAQEFWRIYDQALVGVFDDQK